MLKLYLYLEIFFKCFGKLKQQEVDLIIYVRNATYFPYFSK
jgi:hypothetical protein